MRGGVPDPSCIWTCIPSPKTAKSIRTLRKRSKSASLRLRTPHVGQQPGRLGRKWPPSHDVCLAMCQHFLFCTRIALNSTKLTPKVTLIRFWEETAPQPSCVRCPRVLCMYIPRFFSEARSLESGTGSTLEKNTAEDGAGDHLRHGQRYDWAKPITRRQFSDNPVENTNTKIGIAVGVLLGVFLLATLAFLWTYRFSVRCSTKRHKSAIRKSSQSSSKSSKAASDNGGDAPAPPPEPAAADPPEAASK